MVWQLDELAGQITTAWNTEAEAKAIMESWMKPGAERPMVHYVIKAEVVSTTTVPTGSSSVPQPV